MLKIKYAHNTGIFTEKKINSMKRNYKYRKSIDMSKKHIEKHMSKKYNNVYTIYRKTREFL